MSRGGGEDRELGKKKTQHCLSLYIFTLPVLICFHPQGNQRNTHIGSYDLQTKQNEHLYMFERDLHIISCSVNNERTLLAVSFRQYTEEERVSQLLQSVSKYLTLLIEIQPINNVRVLKAVDSCVRVQFLYPVEDRNTSTESRLLLVSEDKCEFIF
uniref:Uncharacterized protein n=1 Tax=Athene cunicularia TaxID=194338 RepID=A0A663LSA0_ATHCN